MRRIFQIAIMTTPLLIATQPVFAEAEKSKGATIPKKEPAMETHKPQAAKPAAAAPAEAETAREEAMPPPNVKKKKEVVDYYTVCQTKPWLCND